MQHLKTLGLAAALMTGLLLVPATDAAAHERLQRGHGHWDVPAHVRYHRAVMPRWLRKHRGFRHWYRYNQYRYPAHVSWRKLFRRYQRDRYYHRDMRGWYDDRRYRKRYRDRYRERYYDYDDDSDSR